MVGSNKTSVVGKITNILLDILIFIFGIILLISLYNMVQVKILGNSYSSFFGYTLFEVQTGSMEDEISAGDWIIIKSQTDYKPNDIVTFSQGDNFITHRIIEQYNDTFITKGDANSGEDDPIVKEQIIGEVVGIIPFFGLFRMTILNPYILIILIGIVYIYNLNYNKKGGNSKVFYKIKRVVSEIKNSLFKEKVKEKPALFDDDNDNEVKVKSFENIGTQPKISDYAEKVENYKNSQLYDEDENEDENEEIEADKKEDSFADKEEDLSKTMFFRIISVDDNDEDIAFIEEQKAKAEVESVEKVEEEKIIEEVEDEIEEITKGQLEEMMEEPEEKSTTEDDDEESKLKLEMIFNKPEHKKSKNIIARGMAIKEEELNSVIDAIIGENKLLVNEASIKKMLIKSYIESKYFNIYSENVANLDNKKTTQKKNIYITDNKMDVINERNGFSKNIKLRVRKVLTRIGFAIEEDSEKITKNYLGNDKSYSDKVKKYANMMTLIAKLEYLVDINKDMKSKRMLYAKEIIKYITEYNLEHESIESLCKDVIHIQKAHRSASKYFVEKLNTEVFEIKYNQLKVDKNKYLLNLKHNISFSQVYSDFVVDRTYQEGIVAEDKLNVLLTLLQAKLVTDMIDGDFTNEYIVLVPSSLCAKESKFERLLKQNNEEYAKKNIIFLIEYDEFMKHNAMIKRFRKAGFRISIYINSQTKFASKNKLYLAIAEQIYIDKEVKGIVDIEKVVLNNFKDKIIKDDISNKIEVVEDGR